MLAARRPSRWVWAFFAFTGCAPAASPVPSLPGPASPVAAARADERDPKTWVRRLDDPLQRAFALKRLQLLLEEALAKANDDHAEPRVKALLDDMVGPLTELYTTGSVTDDPARLELLALLAETRDPRTAPALAKALGEDPKARPAEVKLAARATTNLAKEGNVRDVRLVDALWGCFAKLRPSHAGSIELAVAVHDAVLAVEHPSYGPKAIDLLSGAVDRRDPASVRDELQFRQMTAIQVLGALRFGAGARALVATMVSPAKADLRATASAALLRMPSEAEAPLLAALGGKDPGLVSAAAGDADKLHLAILAEPIGYLSRSRGRDALLDVLSKADNDQVRTLVALNLVRFPFDQKTESAYLAAYKKVDPEVGLALMAGSNARALLLRAASRFYDAKLVEWLAKEMNAAKADQVDEVSSNALQAMAELMKPDQLKTVELAAKKLIGPAVEKDELKVAIQVVERCKADVPCYLQVLDEPIPSAPRAAKMGARKACWMAAMFGNDRTRKDLLAKVDTIKDAGVRTALVDAIVHLAPKGDPDAADALDRIVSADRASTDVTVLQGDSALIKASVTLRSRAMP